MCPTKNDNLKTTKYKIDNLQKDVNNLKCLHRISVLNYLFFIFQLRSKHARHHTYPFHIVFVGLTIGASLRVVLPCIFTTDRQNQSFLYGYDYYYGFQLEFRCAQLCGISRNCSRIARNSEVFTGLAILLASKIHLRWKH